MDRRVNVRFYEVITGGGGRAPLADNLRLIAELPKHEREETIHEEITLRLEDLRERDGLIIGDITRVQTHNLPGHVLAEEVDRLPVDRIGHSTAFLYDPANGCLAAQFDMQTGVGRIGKYVAQAADGEAFSYLPYLRGDTLDRFRDERPTRLRLRISRVRNFGRVENQMTDFERQIREMAELYDAPSVEIILSTRGQDQQLDENRVWNTVRRWLGFADEVGGIKNVEARTIETDEAFNFLKDLLCEESTLDLPDNEPLQSRAMRQDFVLSSYRIHREYINRVSGAV